MAEARNSQAPSEQSETLHRWPVRMGKQISLPGMKHAYIEMPLELLP
jgi:hypothetical protein